MITRFLALLISTLALHSCVSADLYATNYYKLTDEETTQLTSGGYGANVLELHLYSPCSTLDLRFRNIETGQGWGRRVVLTYSPEMSSYDAGQIPIVLVLPAGQYVFRGGTCTWATGGGGSGTTVYTRSLNDLALWLRSFDFRAGEIAYPGTIRATGKIVKEWGIGLTPLERINGRKLRSSDSYYVYSVEDNDAKVREALELYNPSLASRLFNRVKPPLLDEEVVRKIIDDAYADFASSIPPDEVTARSNALTARARVKEGLSQHMQSVLGAEGTPAPKPEGDIHET
jgi:hypothetical protein